MSVTVPAMVNAHSHAFQIDLRGAGERPTPAAHGADDFWSWRTEMFRLARGHDPDTMRDAGARAYAQMADAGYGAVGEFHYVHHQPDGTPYDEPNAMALALIDAALEQGLEIVLIATAYHRAGWNGGDLPPVEGQRRFCDPDVETFLERVDALRASAQNAPGVHVGVAAHSVRAVPASWIEAIGAYAHQHGLVRHVHACEQRRELDECAAEHGCTPIELLERTGFLGPFASVVHGIHVDERDIALLAESATTVVSCPTTEGNLGDGYLPALRYRAAGVPIAIGTDSQVRLDPFEEARELETGARREGLTRHGLLAATGDLWGTLVDAGRTSIGLSGPPAEIEIDPAHPQLAGVQRRDLPYALATCASSAIVTRTAGGRAVGPQA
jgi:formimidoylglutamate deiminase